LIFARDGEENRIFDIRLFFIHGIDNTGKGYTASDYPIIER